MTGTKRNRATRNLRLVQAVGYLRTSSATNVGRDKDSDKRQREAIQAFARAAGYIIADDDWFYDAAVSGADALDKRPGFVALLDRIESNGVRHVIVESSDRFARELQIQETGIALLKARGVTLLTADGNDLTDSSDPMRKLIRQITGAIAEFEKSRTVEKLAGARARKRERTGRCEGRKPLTETNPEALKLARKLRRANPTTGKRMSFRDIAEKLAEAGHVAASGKPLSPSVVKRLLGE